ncbi:MAG: RNA chaperone Hfq [Terriglobales bacterium]
MEAKPAQQNIQDSFLNTARKERHNITIYLVSGVKLTISTVVIVRGAHSHADAKPAAVASQGEAEIANSASGTEG